ncbi:diazepam binding inhibitor, splice form 1D(1) [Baffinella frigidus]|nr:diazepam binding inhibitor, splice form 1D(1) [Cryptophyta sp. CCMP2293]
MTSEHKLQLHGCFQQATVGDCDTEKPGMLDFSGKAKWEAWNKVKGMPKREAMQTYIDLVDEFKTLDIKF